MTPYDAVMGRESRAWALVLVTACAGESGEDTGEDATGASTGGSTGADATTTEDDGGPGDATTGTSTPGDTGDDSTTSTSDASSDDGTTGGSEGGASSSESGTAVDCEPGSKPGASGSTNDWPTAAGVTVNVRTPDDYDATVATPLIVVFAPAGADAYDTEGFTGLTPAAVGAGYAIAYVDHVSPMTIGIIDGLSVVLDDLVDEWCVDPSRVYYTGHSDGGSISEALLAIDEDDPRPTAAAPSAAGITGTTMSQIGCPPQPRPIMVMHSAMDGLFPPASGFGLGAAEVWADCNGCSGEPTLVGACLQFPGCTAQTLYCEGNGTHGQWPGQNDEIIAFFDAN